MQVHFEHLSSKRAKPISCPLPRPNLHLFHLYTACQVVKAGAVTADSESSSCNHCRFAEAAASACSVIASCIAGLHQTRPELGKAQVQPLQDSCTPSRSVRYLKSADERQRSSSNLPAVLTLGPEVVHFARPLAFGPAEHFFNARPAPRRTVLAHRGNTPNLKAHLKAF